MNKSLSVSACHQLPQDNRVLPDTDCAWFTRERTNHQGNGSVQPGRNEGKQCSYLTTRACYTLTNQPIVLPTLSTRPSVPDGYRVFRCCAWEGNRNGCAVFSAAEMKTGFPDRVQFKYISYISVIDDTISVFIRSKRPFHVYG